MDKGAEHPLRSCLGIFGGLQKFLEGSWVGRSEKQRFSCEEKRGQMFEEQRIRRGCGRRWSGMFRLSGATGKARKRRGRHQRNG